MEIKSVSLLLMTAKYIWLTYHTLQLFCHKPLSYQGGTANMGNCNVMGSNDEREVEVMGGMPFLLV